MTPSRLLYPEFAQRAKVTQEARRARHKLTRPKPQPRPQPPPDAGRN